ncbi:hypothetical protein AB0L06_19410 [Spirillospora sp. NPDC052269]
MPDGEEASCLGEFSARLHSDDIEVVCDALSDYQRAQAGTRCGFDNRYRPLDNEVLFVARDILDRASTLDEEHRERALSWSLTMVWHLGESEDADRIADVLEGDLGPGLRKGALGAASTALEDGEEPNPRLLAAVRAAALDESLDARARGSAIHALGDLDLPEVEELIVHLTGAADLVVQVEAARQLTTPHKVRKHRELLQRLVDSWPKDGGPWFGDVRDSLEGFHSLYWQDAHLDDPALRHAHDELQFPLSDETFLDAFATLLHSESPVAVGIALDHYERWDGLRHVLDDDQADALLPEVLERAREVLRRPISPAEVSALTTIGSEYAQPDDAEPLVDVLTRPNSGQERHKATWMALGVFEKSDVPDADLVEAVGCLVFDPSLGEEETAIRVLAEGLGADADELLLRALRETAPKVQAHAAYYLVSTGGLDRHRAVMEEAAERWDGERSPARPWGQNPADLILGKPHSVHWQGHRLPDPDLYRAHRRLRHPEADESYHEAMRTMLESGDVAAVGIALDHWWDAEGASARGGDGAREPARALVLTLISEILRQPQSPPELSREYGPTAAHRTALSALKVAAQDDLSVLADALENADAELRELVLDAARDVLWSVQESHPRLAQALGDVACDETVPMDDRGMAVYLVGDFRADNTVDVLLRVIRCRELKIQAAAALALIKRETFEQHRTTIEALAAGWPTEDVPTEVVEVREILDDLAPADGE